MGRFKDSISKFFGGEITQGSQSFAVGGFNGLESLNRKQLLNQYGGIVFSCINVRSQEVAKYQPLIYKQNPRIVTDQEPEVDHPLLQFLDRPNPTQSKYEIIELTQIFMDLAGECFWYIEVGEITRQPKNAYIVEPHRVTPATNNRGEIIGYVVRKDDGTEIPLELDEMIHFKYPNPSDPLRGKSPTGANLLYIDTEKQTSEFQNSFMRNSATPSGVATVKGGITSEAFKKLKLQWKDQQQGTKNAGKTLFIRNGDFTFEKLGLSLADLDMDALKGQTQDDVRRAFRVPKPKLGDTDGVGLGRDGAETVNYIFASDVIDGLQMRLDDTFQRYARIAYKDQNIFVDHVCQIPENEQFELEEYKAKVQEWNLGVNRWIPVNEILREKNQPEIPGGDVLYRALGQVPLGEDNPPTIEVQPKMVTRQTIKRTPKALPEAKKELSRDNFFGKLDRQEDLTAKRYRGLLRTFLQAQEKTVLSKLRANKALDDQVLVGFVGKEPELVLNLVEVLLEESQTAGQLAVEFTKTPIVYEIPERFPISLEDDTARVIQGFNEQTSQALRDAITEGLEKGDDFNKLSSRVKNIYEIADNSRADRIARTETHRVINESVAEAYKSVGIRSMQWVTDSDPCELCEAMEGTITDIDTPFLEVGDTIEGVSGKQFTVDYQNVKAADLHPNCACKLVPVTPGQGNFSLKPDKVIVKIRDDEENSRLKEALLKEQAFTEELKKIIGIDDGS